jgi:hypothetical protein
VLENIVPYRGYHIVVAIVWRFADSPPHSDERYSRTSIAVVLYFISQDATTILVTIFFRDGSLKFVFANLGIQIFEALWVFKDPPFFFEIWYHIF